MVGRKTPIGQPGVTTRLLLGSRFSEDEPAPRLTTPQWLDAQIKQAIDWLLHATLEMQVMQEGAILKSAVSALCACALSPLLFASSLRFNQQVVELHQRRYLPYLTGPNDDCQNGLYSIRIEMKEGGRGRATGVIVLLDGQILGGDTHFYNRFLHLQKRQVAR